MVCVSNAVSYFLVLPKYLKKLSCIKQKGGGGGGISDFLPKIGALIGVFDILGMIHVKIAGEVIYLALVKLICWACLYRQTRIWRWRWETENASRMKFGAVIF